MEYRERSDPLSWMNWALPAGSLSGVRIFVHWTFPLFLVLYPLVEGIQAGAAWGWMVAVTVVALFGIVLLHEFGHVFAGRREGVEAEKVTLSVLGGLATLGEERVGGAEVRIAAAGPAVNLAFVLLFLPLFAAIGIRIGPDFLNPMWFWPTPVTDGVQTTVQQLAYLIHKANLIVLLFNLIPAFPMDGGRILRGLLHGRQGRIRSTITVTTIALFAAAGILVWAVLSSKLVLAFIAVFVGWSAWVNRRQALAIAQSEMGLYEGYSAFEASVAESTRLSKREEKERKRRETEAEKDREIEARMDELLEKISREGINSLTRKEQAFLTKASQRKSGS
ncbi:MAG: site-2 protease family protein [Planctomycetota bacterium]